MLLVHGDAPSVTLVPASCDGGANALVCSPPHVIPFSFGEASCARHAQAARAAGIEPEILPLERLSQDWDRPDDLVHFLRTGSRTRPLEEIAARVSEAWGRGATEVCMQGGIHPDYTGSTYLGACRMVKATVPEMHVQAYSPLEVWQGAKTLGVSLREFLWDLKRAGLGTLPGTAAEILDDEIRTTRCPDKIATGEWLEVM